MDKEIKEQFRSIHAMVCMWGALILAMVSFLGFNMDKTQTLFWGIVCFFASSCIIFFVIKDAWETWKYKKENKKEELKNG
jgi:Na+/melibiose symporter-like transporter